MPRFKGNPDPWDRQKGEYSKAFAKFQDYLLAGLDRSLQKTAKSTGFSFGNIADLSREHRWMERVQAWDDKLAEERRLQAEEAIQKMHSRHAALAMKIQSKVNEALDAMEKGKYPKGQLANALARAAEIERVARGEPGKVEEIRETKGDQFDFSGWSDEDLTDFDRLYRKATVPQGGEEGTPEEEPPPVH